MGGSVPRMKQEDFDAVVRLMLQALPAASLTGPKP
jgi:hypothetical protein